MADAVRRRNGAENLAVLNPYRNERQLLGGAPLPPLEQRDRLVDREVSLLDPAASFPFEIAGSSSATRRAIGGAEGKQSPCVPIDSCVPTLRALPVRFLAASMGWT